MLALVCSVMHVRDSPVRTRSSKWTNIFPSAFSVIFRVLAYRWRSRFENNSEQLGLEGEFWRRSNEERGAFVWVDFKYQQCPTAIMKYRSPHL